MEEKIKKGFDRDVDYLPMKDKLIDQYNDMSEKYLKSSFNTRAGTRLVFLLISMIQLRNGSRISEAINAFIKFVETDISNKVIIKIAKSGGTKFIFNKRV